jgi:tetratricopeptide (TPR) repeat protein
MSEAFVAYENGEYQRASELFSSMLLKNPLNSELWHALAATRKMEFRYDEAIEAWTLSSLLNPQSPLPHFYQAECYLAQDRIEKALDAFDSALQCPCTEDLIDKIQAMKEVITHDHS